MASVLIGYATRSGAARDAALTVAETLEQTGHEVRVADLRDKPAVDDADLVIVGSGIHAGSWYSEALGWVGVHVEELRDRRVAVFNTCLRVLEPGCREQALGYNATVAQRCGAECSESFAGRYVPAKVGLLRRLLMRSMQKPAQDHFDADAVRDWASGLFESPAG